MVKVYFDKQDNNFHFVMFKEQLFEDVLQTIKNGGCYYQPDTKHWILPNCLRVQTTLTELSKLTSVLISEEDKKLVSSNIYPKTKEIKRVRRTPDKELIEQFPPLKGKEGKENFQSEAISKLVQTNRSICNISCRHGKTYMMCMTLGTLYKQGVIDRILIICKPEGYQNFYSEICFFLNNLFNEEDIAIITTKDREIEKAFDKKIIITNYTTFRLSVEYYNGKKLTKQTRRPSIQFNKWGKTRAIVLDEIQCINHHTSLQSKAIHLHKDFFEYRYGLSGTLGFDFFNWYSLTRFMIPQKMAMPYSLWKSYITETPTGSWYKANPRPQKAKEFKTNILDPLLLTYTDCIQQQKDTERLIYCVMSKKMRELYISLCNDWVEQMFKDNPKLSGKTVLSKFGKLASITSDPSLKDVDNWDFLENPKIEVVSSLLNKFIEEENQKTIIWSAHPSILNKLAKIFEQYKPTVIHGDENTSVDKKDRIEELNKFKNDPSRKLLLTNKVLSTSIDITCCSKQIYWDLFLSSDDLYQSRERIRGPKQTKPTETIFLLFDNSVDLYIWNEIILKKDKTRKAMITNSSISIQSLKNLLNPTRLYYTDGTKA